MRDCVYTRVALVEHFTSYQLQTPNFRTIRSRIIQTAFYWKFFRRSRYRYTSESGDDKKSDISTKNVKKSSPFFEAVQYFEV